MSYRWSKGKTTNKLYEVSHHIVQGYNNIEKITLLTQAPIIQQYNQSLLLSITLAVCQPNMKIILYDIIQAYILSTTKFNCI